MTDLLSLDEDSLFIIINMLPLRTLLELKLVAKCFEGLVNRALAIRAKEELIQPIADFSIQAHMLVLFKNNQILTQGENRYGELGQDITDNANIIAGNLFDNKIIINVAVGFEHSLFLTEDGIAFSCGMNGKGQLGLGDDIISLAKPQKISFPQDIKAIAAGWEHSVFLTREGLVFVAGAVELDEYKYTGTPKKIEGLEDKIISISTSGCYTLLLSQRGEVYSIGWLAYAYPLDDGENNLTYNDDFMLAKKIDLPPGCPKIIAIAAGDDHSLLLDEEGEVYAFGLNYYGQLGLGHTFRCDNPTLIGKDAFQGQCIKAIAVGDNHSIVLTTQGQVFGFGKNSHGQLGVGQDISQSTSPKLLPTSSFQEQKIIAIRARNRQTVMLSTDGILYYCGEDFCKLFEEGNEPNMLVFTPVKIPAVEKVRQKNGEKLKKIIQQGFFQPSISDISVGNSSTVPHI